MVQADRFFDVRFSELVEDPLAMMQRVHHHFDLGWSEEDRVLGQRWLDDERDDARGRHRYDPDLYGLDRDAIHARFADYIEQIGVSTSVRPPSGTP